MRGCEFESRRPRIYKKHLFRRCFLFVLLMQITCINNIIVYTYAVKTESRNTKAKKKIEEVFKKTKAPITLKELYKKVSSVIPGVAYSTVFRIVEKFERKSMVAKVGYKDRGSLYEWSARPHHHHLVCERCSDVTDVSDQILSFSDSKVSKSTGFIITNHSVELTGICKPCQENN